MVYHFEYHDKYKFEINDFGYIENSGWDDKIYRKAGNINDFSDELYKRIHIGFRMPLSILFQRIKKS